MMMKRICDLPPKLVGAKILSKVPITSLGQVRSTCKLWDRLTRDWIVGKEAAAKARQHQFLGFVTVDFKDDKSKLLAWNPYLGQTRSISPRTGDDFHALDTYLFGYDMNRNHKMLRFYGLLFEMYEFSSNSWRVLDVTLPDSWEIKYGGHLIVSFKGNAYFLAGKITTDDVEKDVILCFDFTTETFGLPLVVPFLSLREEAVTLSSVRDQKLALLHQKGQGIIEALEIWITSEEGPFFNAAHAVTWSKFMNVDMRPLIGDRYVRFGEEFASFFIIEEEKVAVVFDIEGYEFCFELIRTDHYHTAFIIGDDDEGYYKTVSLGVAPNLWKPRPGHTGGYYPRGYVPQWYCPPFVCSSSYLPSLVQLNNQPRKRKEIDE
uniref:F-box associated beta-propeller type 1 domain-containing protein n=1 Tax=Brassica oleracea var. oleracea TaxID=109376 RepID=A0A0D3AR64_BRAOL